MTALLSASISIYSLHPRSVIVCELCGQQSPEYQYCNLKSHPCIQCRSKIYSNNIHNQAVNIIIKHISSILTKYSANILTWRIRENFHMSYNVLCMVAV